MSQQQQTIQASRQSRYAQPIAEPRSRRPSDLSDMKTSDLHSNPDLMDPELVAKKEAAMALRLQSDPEFADRYHNYLKIHHPVHEHMHVPVPQYNQPQRPPSDTPRQYEGHYQAQYQPVSATVNRGPVTSMSSAQIQALGEITENRRLLTEACDKYKAAGQEMLHWETEIHRITSLMETRRAIAEVEGVSASSSH